MFALPNNGLTEWPKGGTNDVKTDLPKPPAVENIVDLSGMFNYPTLDYGGLSLQDQNRKSELDVIKSLKGYVPKDDSSVTVITRDAPWQAGVMWSKESNKINLAEPFHMVSYVYLGIRGQAERNADGNRAGADGITFTMHNDKKSPVASESGSTTNTGINAYGALGNGLGVYGNNFSANTGSDSNNMAYMTKGVTNGIALEFDTFYNHNNTSQHSDNDLWQFVGNEGSSNSNLGHIGINYLNNLQDNKANEDFLTINKYKKFSTDTYSDTTMIKHSDMLSVGWNGNVTGLSPDNGWQVTGATQKLADNKWHRLEVKWEPKTLTTGELTYRIYQQGHTGERNISDIYDTSKDGTAVLEKTVTVDVGKVFGVSDINKTVFWGFTGSTGYYQNNQAVQMLQLPKPYYKSGIRKVDQDKKLVKNAKFQLQVRNEGIWQPVVFQKVVGSETQDYVLTGVDNGLIGVTTDLEETSPTYGTVTATQLLAGTYRWVEIEAPEGYEIESPITPYNGFELKYLLGSPNNGLSIDFDVRNIKLSQIELYKYDEDTKQPLNGAKFTISKVLDGVTSYLKAKLNESEDESDFEWTTTEDDAKEFETGISYFVRNGKIVEENKKDGYIRIGYIENGANLSWKEVEVPKGYDSSGTLTKLTGDFKPSSTDNGYVYSATQTNSRLYQVSLEKKASDTEPPAPLPGAVFSLQKKVDQNWETVSQDGVSEFTTNSEGKISISNLTA
ncbi:lectin-like domain-containing protein, partial [Jeotgalibaca arthritidis]|uniref:lectin-like domain-containing protein n=1 Tax=Jeotgalibaca arthritidis TaxID=1868794 RepID=UPI0035A07BA5